MHLRDQIKQEAERHKPQRTPAIVPEWGLTEEEAAKDGGRKAFVRVLGISEHDNFNRSFLVERNGKMERDPKNYRAKFIAACLEDEAGKLIFGDDDLTWLAEQPTPVGERVVTQCHEVNGIGEDTRKNSSTTPAPTSSTT